MVAEAIESGSRRTMNNAAGYLEEFNELGCPLD
jgi:hypothetical protein